MKIYLIINILLLAFLVCIVLFLFIDFLKSLNHTLKPHKKLSKIPETSSRPDLCSLSIPLIYPHVNEYAVAWNKLKKVAIEKDDTETLKEMIKIECEFFEERNKTKNIQG